MRVEITSICSSSELDSLTLTESDRAYINTLSSAKRRCEVASWRSLLRATLRDMGLAAESDILYSDVGAPYLKDTYIHIGVSHSRDSVAVIISREGRCAIDIEDSRRDFERVARRYATPAEIALFGGDSQALAVIWSAKETLYKLAAASGLDLIGDIEILGVEPNTLTGRVLGLTYTLAYFTQDNHIVVHTI